VFLGTATEIEGLLSGAIDIQLANGASSHFYSTSRYATLAREMLGFVYVMHRHFTHPHRKVFKYFTSPRGERGKFVANTFA